MNILNKFDNVKIENNNRLTAEDMEFCRKEEQRFLNAFNCYTEVYKIIKSAFDIDHETELAEKYGAYIYEYSDISPKKVQDTIVKMKAKFIWHIVKYFNKKYSVNLQTDNEFKSGYNQYHDKPSKLESITADWIIDNYIFGQLDGLNFTEYALNKMIKENTFKKQQYNTYYKTWNYKVKNKSIKFDYSICKTLPLLYYYDGSETEIKRDFTYDKIDKVTEYKNGTVKVDFTSAEYAEEFAKKYLGYVKLSEQETDGKGD